MFERLKRVQPERLEDRVAVTSSRVFELLEICSAEHELAPVHIQELLLDLAAWYSNERFTLANAEGTPGPGRKGGAR